MCFICAVMEASFDRISLYTSSLNSSLWKTVRWGLLGRDVNAGESKLCPLLWSQRTVLILSQSRSQRLVVFKCLQRHGDCMSQLDCPEAFCVKLRELYRVSGSTSVSSQPARLLCKLIFNCESALIYLTLL